jgi:CRP-like cAMP-binding protein
LTNDGIGYPLAPIARLAALAPLDQSAISILQEACAGRFDVEAHRPVPSDLNDQPVMIVSGWAGRIRNSASGRCLMVDLALPGEIVRPIDLASSTLTAITDLQVAVLPNAAAYSPLARAYARSYQLTESYLMAQVARVALLDAQDGLLDLITELLERVLVANGSNSDCFDLPLTQRHLGEVLGLTSVHVNRMVRQLREKKRIIIARGSVQIPAGSPVGQHARRNVEAIRAGSRFPQRVPFFR